MAREYLTAGIVKVYIDTEGIADAYIDRLGEQATDALEDALEAVVRSLRERFGARIDGEVEM